MQGGVVCVLSSTNADYYAILLKHRGQPEYDVLDAFLEDAALAVFQLFSSRVLPFLRDLETPRTNESEVILRNGAFVSNYLRVSEEERWILEDQIRDQGQAARSLLALRLMLFLLSFRTSLR